MHGTLLHSANQQHYCFLTQQNSHFIFQFRPSFDLFSSGLPVLLCNFFFLCHLYLENCSLVYRFDDVYMNYTNVLCSVLISLIKYLSWNDGIRNPVWNFKLKDTQLTVCNCSSSVETLWVNLILDGLKRRKSVCTNLNRIENERQRKRKRIDCFEENPWTLSILHTLT